MGDKEDNDLSKYRISCETIEAAIRMKNSEQFIRGLEDYLEKFVTGGMLASSKFKGFDRIADNKLEIGSKLKKNTIGLKIVTEIAPNYGIEVRTVRSASIKFITLVRGAKARKPPILLSHAINEYKDDISRYKSVEIFPPEQILVFICDSEL